MAKRDINVGIVGVYLIGWWGFVAALLVYLTSNAAPGAPKLEWRDLKEEGAFTTTKLSVDIAMDAADADGDKVTYTYSWTVNGEPYTGDKPNAKSMSTKQTKRDEVWEVTVRPDDGTNESWGCSLPWRQCAGDPANDAKLSITVANSPPRARIRFVDEEDKEPEKFEERKLVKLDLSCADADFVDIKRAEAAKAKEEGRELPKPAEGEEPPDPCTYDVKWHKYVAPEEGEEAAEITEETEADFTEMELPAKEAKAGDRWIVRVRANDGEVDGEWAEETLEIEEKS